MNSIQANLNVQNHIANIIQAIRGLAGSRRHLIVVEGEDDKEFYSRFFNDAHTHLYVECSCQYYDVIATACNSAYPNRFSMIKDADFDLLMSVKPSADNIFLTDFHDAEMFLMDTDVKDILKSAFGCEIDVMQIESHICCLSMTKWYNMSHGCKQRFAKKCTIQKLYDGTSAINFTDCLIQLASDQKNQGKTAIALPDLEAFAKSKSKSDWRQYTNGHDLLHAMATAINKNTNSAISEINIRAALEGSYSLSLFQMTLLYSSLKKLEKTVHLPLCK